MANDPKWVELARKEINVAEIPGSKENQTILGYWKTAAASASETARNWIVSALGNTEATAWCGTFAAAMFQKAGLAVPLSFYSALKWASYGKRLDEPQLGAIMVFKRTGGGHVGFYVGEDKDCYHILGGNQGDRVSIARLEKTRLVDVRWPIAIDDKPYKGRILATLNNTISKDEA